MSFASGDGCVSKIVLFEDAGCWVADMASPSLEIGSRVTYVLAVKEERKKVREDTNRCDEMGRKDAIVVIHENS